MVGFHQSTVQCVFSFLTCTKTEPPIITTRKELDSKTNIGIENIYRRKWNEVNKFVRRKKILECLLRLKQEFASSFSDSKQTLLVGIKAWQIHFVSDFFCQNTIFFARKM